jgi:hypothetical protein
VSITPLKRPRQQPEEDEPFMDEPYDAYKDWLKELPEEQSRSMPSMFQFLFRILAPLYKLHLI